MSAIVERLKVNASQLNSLAERGLLVTDSDKSQFRELRVREAALRETGWAKAATAYHHSSRRQMRNSLEGARVLRDPARRRILFEKYVVDHGPPPPAFFLRNGQRVSLPQRGPEGDLWTTLRARVTSRVFDGKRDLDLGRLSELLQATFGCLDIASLATGVEVLRRTSPSGGGLHPIEAFPLVMRIDNLEAAVYHYDSKDHELVLQVRFGDRQEAMRRAARLCLGQPWGAEANALIFLVARYDRAFWKYRDNERAFSVVLLDVGHLSQTFYLAATALGLGAFFSAAIDQEGVDSLLGLDGVTCSSIGVLGCGWKDRDDPFRLWPRRRRPISAI